MQAAGFTLVRHWSVPMNTPPPPPSPTRNAFLTEHNLGRGTLVCVFLEIVLAQRF